MGTSIFKLQNNIIWSYKITLYGSTKAKTTRPNVPLLRGKSMSETARERENVQGYI